MEQTKLLKEYEKAQIKTYRIATIFFMTLSLLLLFFSDFNVSTSKPITTIVVVGLAGTIIYLMQNKDKPKDLLTILPIVQKKYREVFGEMLSYRDLTAINFGERYYFYFPDQMQGFEYSLNKGFTAIENLDTETWLERAKDDKMYQVMEKDLVEYKKDEKMEEKGYEKKQ